MDKIRLHVKVRGHGARIESVPIKKLEKLSRRSKKTWYYVSGWLILETY